jgi:hypothetical protein
MRRSNCACGFAEARGSGLLSARLTRILLHVYQAALIRCVSPSGSHALAFAKVYWKAVRIIKLLGALQFLLALPSAQLCSSLKHTNTLPSDDLLLHSKNSYLQVWAVAGNINLHFWVGHHCAHISTISQLVARHSLSGTHFLPVGDKT